MTFDQSEKKAFFSLKKYYVDLVTDEGKYFIGYSAKLKFGAFKMNYSSTLSDFNIKGIKRGPVFNSEDEIRHEGNLLKWESKQLGFKGLWKGRKAVPKKTLLKNKDGKVLWECLAPSALTELQTYNGEKYTGFGYAEFLNMTIAPWKLGLDTLYWGRFVNEKYSVVWIEWQGLYPLSFVTVNGKFVNHVIISDTHIKSEGFEIMLEQRALIRSGALGKTVFSKVPSILKLAPVKFLSVKEEKFLSCGAFSSENGEQSKGWVIHEKIIWS